MRKSIHADQARDTAGLETGLETCATECMGRRRFGELDADLTRNVSRSFLGGK